MQSVLKDLLMATTFWKEHINGATLLIMKRFHALLIALFTSVGLFGQHDSKILEAPEDWGSEQFLMPPGFAPDIEFQGIEDIRFSPGWNDSTSVQFWAYVFVWQVEYTGEISEKILEHSLNLYYDGLMGTDSAGANREYMSTGTTSSFQLVDGVFLGEVEVFDRFFSKQSITLYIRVTDEYCEEKNKQNIRFDIATIDFSNLHFWTTFDDVTIAELCLEP